MKKSESDSLVMLLTAAFPHTKASKETCAVYSELLQDLDFEVAKKAVTILVSSEQFLPTVASIREQCVTLQIGPRKTGVEAWAEAGQTCRKFGPYKKPNWSDQLIPQALQVFGGYVAFCNSPADDAAGRARFIELYDVLSKRARDEQRTGVALPAPGGALPPASVFGLMGQGKPRG